MDISTQATTILRSEWMGLSKHLLADFFEVDRTGKAIGNVIVRAPLTEANLEITLNWNSPFENAGAESKAPALLAMLQSGALSKVADSVKAYITGNDAQDMNQAAASVKRSNEFLKSFEGRTGITKLNSTQVFTGMPPMKIPVTALFRA